MRATDGTGFNGHTNPQHVFIDLSSGRYVGLLVEWRREGDSWKGWCIWAADGPVVSQAWLDAKQISPFDLPGHQPQT